MLLLEAEVLLDHLCEIHLVVFKAWWKVQLLLDLFWHILTFNGRDSGLPQVLPRLGFEVS
jgi:hypothetical protein